MKNIVSKNWISKNLILLSWGLLLLALSSLWLNVFGELLKGSIDLPVPTATTQLVDAELNNIPHEKSALINKIAAYADDDKEVRTPYATLPYITEERGPNMITKSYALPLFASDFLLSIPELFSSVQNHGTKLNSNVTVSTGSQSELHQGVDYKHNLDALNAQFKVPSNYASFFSVTLMQDRLPPAITQNSASTSNVNLQTSSPKPKLRPQNLNNGIFISVGYFTIKQNVERTLQTLELTGYNISQRRLNEGGSLVTVGPFSTKASAQKALEITKIVGFSDAYIVN